MEPVELICRSGKVFCVDEMSRCMGVIQREMRGELGDQQGAQQRGSSGVS